MSTKYQRSFPKKALRLTTGCQYCAVGCGYNAFLVPLGAAAGDDNRETWNGVSRFVTPAMRNTIRFNGKTWKAAVAPDTLCDLNRGNHSVRGGSQGPNLVTPADSSSSGDPASTRERLISPSILCLDENGNRVREEITWEKLNTLMAHLIVKTTGMEVTENDQIRVNFPERLGVKLYEYQFLENTFAATKLFYNCIGTPNLAYHDRPSAAGSSPGMKDAGYRPHDFSYEEVHESELLVFIGTNPYENQSVFFMQHCVGKEMIVIDPRKTATAQYAEQTGGLHLQPSRLGADSILVYALCRALIEQWETDYGAPLKKEDLLLAGRIIDNLEELVPVDSLNNLAENDKERFERMRRVSRAMTFDDFIEFLKTDTFALAKALKTCGLMLDGQPLDVDGFREKTVRRFLNRKERKGFRKIGIFYEKGMIWGFNYNNTASVASLGLLLGAYGEYGCFVGRVGGHQKGWAAAKSNRRHIESVFEVGFKPDELNRSRMGACTSDKSGTGDPSGEKMEGYPFRNASDLYTDKYLKKLLKKIRAGTKDPNKDQIKFLAYQKLCGDQQWIKVPHNLDNHLFGVMEPDELLKNPGSINAVPSLRGNPTRVQLPNGLVTNKYPDVELLWIIGGNYFGQNNQAEAKRKRLEGRLHHNRAGLLPTRAQVRTSDVKDLIAVYEKRLATGDDFSKGLVTVHQDIYANPTTNFCDIAIPAAGWGEDSFMRYNAQRRLKLYDRFQDMPLHPKDQGLAGDPYDHIETSAWKHSPKPDWLVFKGIARAIGTHLQKNIDGLFNWQTSADVADEMVRHSNRTGMLTPILDFADTRLPDDVTGRVHRILGFQDSPADIRNGVFSPHLREGYEIEFEENEPGTGNESVYRNGFTTNGVIHPLRFDRERGKLIGRLRNVRNTDTKKLCFVKAPWEGLIKKTFEKEMMPSGNEIIVTNGRVNHLWNNMFHHIRNTYVNQRYPDDLPGTVLELGQGTVDEGGVPLQSGHVVEVRERGSSFKAIVSIQDSTPGNLAFAMFSYPVNKMDDQGQRAYSFDGYVNNITVGYMDGINPIAALKYGKATIKVLYHQPALMPTYAPRNQIRPANHPNSPGQSMSRAARDTWELRELVVTKGLPRAFVREQFHFRFPPHAVTGGSGPIVVTGPFWRIPNLSAQEFLDLRIFGERVGDHLLRRLKTDMPSGMLNPTPLPAGRDTETIVDRIEALLAQPASFGNAEYAELQVLLDEMVAFAHRSVAAFFLEPDALMELMTGNPKVRDHFIARLNPEGRGMTWTLDSTIVDQWSVTERKVALRWNEQI